MRRGTVAAVAILAYGSAGVASIQPRLAQTVHEVKERDDVVVFPPPDELRAAVLGWDAAAVDVLWSSLLVQYGSHFSERREFNQIPRYVDAILALEPTYWPLYKYVDTMLAYRPLHGTERDVVLARQYLERGMRERPQDWRIWVKYGQFLAFVGPSFLAAEHDKQSWRHDGAVALGHAAELGAGAESALSASTMLTRGGATREAVRYLENAYAFTEHPAMREIHEAIGRRLASLEAAADRDEADTVAQAVDARWMADLPYLSRDQALLLGPVVVTGRCAGLGAVDERGCDRSWVAVTGERGSSAGSP